MRFLTGLRFETAFRAWVGAAIANRRCLSCVLVGFGTFGPVVAREAAEIFSPQTYEISRYEHIWEQSPFIVETQVVTQSDGLEKRYSLTGLGKVGDEAIAFLLDRNSQERFSVAVGETPESGVEVISIELDRDPRQSTATIRVGSEQASIGYDPAALLVTAQSNSGVPNGDGARPVDPASIVQRRSIPAPAVVPPAVTPPGLPPAAKTIRRRTITLDQN